MPETLEWVDLKSMSPGSQIDVETKSRHYHIECLGGNSMKISGHPDYCPTPVRPNCKVPPILMAHSNRELSNPETIWSFSWANVFQ